jgi:hypothetical protein
MELAHEQNRSANLFEKEHIGMGKKSGKEDWIPDTHPMLEESLELPESKEEALRR